MAHYPYVNLAGSAGGCTTELTQIAASSTYFYPDYDTPATGLYYIGTEEGWDNGSLNQLYQVGNPLPVFNANCAIKSPVGIVNGDKIKICGIASGPSDDPFGDNTAFSVFLGRLECSEYNNSYSDAWSVSTVIQENYVFVNNHVCWSVEFVWDADKRPACDLQFLLGFGVEEKFKNCRVTWTFDIEKICVGPCTQEYTNVAANSLLFTQLNNAFTNTQYYGFSDKCGWRGSGENFLTLTAGGTIKLDKSFNGIKLPINLIPGDIIQICATFNGRDNDKILNGTQIGGMLNYFKCSEIGTADGDTPIYYIYDEKFEVSGNNLCLSMAIEVPPGGFLACDTMFLLGFGTDQLGTPIEVTYTMNIIRTCGSCTVEYTPIAKTSGRWDQQKGIGGAPLYYIGNEFEGWNSCSLNVIQQINRQEFSQPVAVDNTNSGIKLPYDLVQGDKIQICGTVVCTNNVSGTLFTAVLTKFMCSGYDPGAGEWTVSPQLGITTAVFNAKNVACWTIEYVVPVEGMPACDTNLILGMKSEIDNLAYRFSWTMDIIKICPEATEIGCCFTHAKTVFVDPNGNDLTALEGKQTKPWKSIASAIEYLSDNGRVGYTVEVFPGDYLNEEAWIFTIANTDATIKLNGNVNIGSANPVIGKGFIQVEDANLKIVGDDRTNSTFAYGGPGAYIQNNSINDAIIYSQGTTDISISNVSMNQTESNPPVIFYEANTNGGKLTLNEVSLLSIRWNIFVAACDRPPVINIKDSVLYTGVNDSTVGWENIRIEPVQGSYNPATWIFIENSRLVVNGYDGAGPDSHILTDCGNSSSIRGIFNGVLFFWKPSAGNVYIWRDGSGQNIDVEIINPIVTNHESWVGGSSFNMITGFGLHTNRGLANPSLYDG